MKKISNIIITYILYDISLLDTHRILHECSCITEFIMLGEKMRCEALPSILLVSPSEFNEFNNDTKITFNTQFSHCDIIA